MYLVKYIEQMGTGTLDMIERCAGAGLREPEFEAAGKFVTRIRRAALAGEPVVFTDRDNVRSRTKAESQLESEQLESESARLESTQLESRPESLRARVLGLLVGGPLSKAALSGRLGQKQASGQLHEVVSRLVADRMIEYTVPDKPRSRLQKYRLTEKGRAALATSESTRAGE